MAQGFSAAAVGAEVLRAGGNAIDAAVATGFVQGVIDPFMGVGSTGVASLELGRRFVGIELDEGYVAAARRRLEAVVEGEPTAGPIAVSR